jgi:2-dehydro-3-deoxygluconokinase
MGYDLVTFGEAMMRLSPPEFRRLEQATCLEIQIGGSELNTAVTAQRLGLRTAFVTCLARNPIGRMVANKASEHGVDISHIIWSEGDRVGLYFMEFGANPRASSVHYDRDRSAMSKVEPEAIRWGTILEGARCFHTSGITTAISEGARQGVKAGIIAAKEKGLVVSFDLNYRRKLWSQEQARAFLAPLMSDVDILFTTEEDAERVFGVRANDYPSLAAKLVNEFGFKIVAVTLREDVSVWRNNWSGIAHDGTSVYTGQTYELDVVDRVGGGDAFCGGFLYAYLNGGNVQMSLDYGVATSALKQTAPGDLNWTTREEVERLIQGASKRIDR